MEGLFNLSLDPDHIKLAISFVLGVFSLVKFTEIRKNDTRITSCS